MHDSLSRQPRVWPEPDTRLTAFAALDRQPRTPMDSEALQVLHRQPRSTEDGRVAAFLRLERALQR